jgi:protein O-GlcNAc transferase
MPPETEIPTIADDPPELALANAHHHAGRFPEAQTIYREILKSRPAHAPTLNRLGVLAIQMGRPQEALQWIDQACAIDTTNPYFYCGRAMALLSLGRVDQAIESYKKAAAIRPTLVDAVFGLGSALQTRGKLAEAATAYEKTLALNPDHLAALNNLGNVLQIQGRNDESVAAYRRVLAIQPENVETHSNLGSSLQRLGKLDEAIECFQRAIALRPDFVTAYNNLANALVVQRRFGDAIELLQKALQLRPDFAEAWYNLGNALRADAQFAPAIDAYQKALTLRSDYVDALNNLGNTFYATRQFKEAAESYLKVLAHRPKDVVAFSNLGTALRTLGAVDEATTALRQAMALRPDYHIACCNLGNVLKDTGNLEKAISCYRRAVEVQSDDSVSHSNLIFTMQYDPVYGAADILREALRFNAMHAVALSGEIRPFDNVPDPDRKLRIGYVAPDFRDHCQSFFTLPLLSNHHHEEFEIYCYSSIPQPDLVTEKITTCADVWRPIAGLTNTQAAELVRSDKIDILVDLTMHMSNGRPLLFARKPAPVQVAWLAYPGTTGLSTIDYRLTDPYLDPPGDSDLAYSEKSVRLPDTFWCYDPLATEPMPNELPAPAQGRITFGCLNNFCKVTAPTLALWARVLNALPDSRILIMARPGKHRQRVLDQLAEKSVKASRIEFIDFQPRDQYLKTYHQIDLGLDTIPYNGHTTSLDSFWMGVPVVTRVGQTVVGRAGLSQLHNLDLLELAAFNDDEFVEIGVKLAGDLPRLASLRSNLRERLQRSPLCDAVLFTRHVESAFRQMWRDWCRQSSPR